MKPLSKAEVEEWVVLFQTQVFPFLTVIGEVNNHVKTVHNSSIPKESCLGTIMMVFIINELFGVFFTHKWYFLNIIGFEN